MAIDDADVALPPELASRRARHAARLSRFAAV